MRCSIPSSRQWSTPATSPTAGGRWGANSASWSTPSTASASQWLRTLAPHGNPLGAVCLGQYIRADCPRLRGRGPPGREGPPVRSATSRRAVRIHVTFFGASIPRSVAQALQKVREDVLWIDDVPDLSQATPDGVWLRRCGAESWLALTRDKKIRTRPAERRAVTEGGVGLFVSSPPQEPHAMGAASDDRHLSRRYGGLLRTNGSSLHL